MHFSIYEILQLTINPREVTSADVTTVEKRLMLTMDMIVMKKKRVAIIKHHKMLQKQQQHDAQKRQTFWDMLKTVSNVRTSGESTANDIS